MRKFLLCMMAALTVALGASGCGALGGLNRAGAGTEAQDGTADEANHDDEIVHPTAPSQENPITTVPETTEEETTEEATTEEETTEEETTEEETAAAAEGSEPEFQVGTWDGLVFTNEWLGLQLTLPEGSRIASAEEIQASVGSGEEVLINDGLYTQEQLDVSHSSTIYDFMVFLPDQSSNIQLLYENTLLSGGGQEVSAADYIDIVSQQLQQLDSLQYEIGSTGQYEIAGETYECLELTLQDGALNQAYFCRAKDGYMICFIATYYDSSFQDTADILDGATALR